MIPLFFTGTGANGEQQLIVNLELNGIKYSGVLVANSTDPRAEEDSDSDKLNAATATTAKSEMEEAEAASEETSNAVKHDNSQEVIQNEAIDEESEQTTDDIVNVNVNVNGVGTGVNVGTAGTAGTGGVNLLKDAMVSS